MNRLELWKKVSPLSVDEFMCLLFGIEPGTMAFDYGDPKYWPENADLIYRMLTADIQVRKLCVFFEDINGDPFRNGAYDRFYSGTDNPWWAACDTNSVGKIHRRELVKWLAEKKIPSDYFGVAVPGVKSIEANAAEVASQPSVESINTDAPTKAKKKYKRGAISALAAATILGVSQRQVQNWDAGINRPDGYPGRRNEAAFHLFVNEWLKTKRLNERARAIHRATPVSSEWIADNEDKEDVFDDD
jgi:hypothetical protein